MNVINNDSNRNVDIFSEIVKVGKVIAKEESLVIKHKTWLKSICSLGFDSASLFFYDDKAQTLIKAGREYSISQRSLIAIVLDKKASVHIDSIEYEGIKYKDRWQDFYNSLHRQFQSMVCSPVFWRGKILGVLNVESYEKNYFDQDAIKIVEMFSFLAGPLLFEEAQIRETSEELTPELEAIELIRKLRSNQVLILGKDSEPEVAILRNIKTLLEKKGFRSILVKDLQEIPEVTNEEKVRILASLCRFVICEDSYPAGQIAELKMCAINRIPTAILREKGKGSTWMTRDYPFDFSFIKEFYYFRNDVKFIEKAVSSAINWANKLLKKKEEYLNDLYPWRESGSKKTDQ